MPCLQCGASKTIKAHLIPEAFVMEVKSDRGEQHLILHEGHSNFQVSNTGFYDQNLLCSACDGVLGSYEGYVFKLLKRLRKIPATSGTIINMGSVDGDKVLRFAAGIAWKYTATENKFGRLDIGPYNAILKEVAFNVSIIPEKIDVTLIRLIELDGDVYFYRAPFAARHAEVNAVRFSVGSFLFILKIDQRPNDKKLPPECWLRGRNDGKFLAADAQYFAEGKLNRKFATSEPVISFFDKMAQRKHQN